MSDKKEKVIANMVCPYNDFLNCFLESCPAFIKKTDPYYNGSGCVYVDARVSPVKY